MKNLVTLLAALLMVLVTSASAFAETSSRPASTEVTSVEQVASGGEPNFMDKYFPFGLPDNLEPEVQSSVGLIWLLSVVAPCGPLWAPAVLTGQGFPDDFVIDLLISDILHVAAQFIPVIGACLVPINCLYLCPVATIAIYDRNLKQERSGARQVNDEGPLGTPPEEPLLSLHAPAPAMAY